MWDLELKSPPELPTRHGCLKFRTVRDSLHAIEDRLEIIEDGSRRFDARAELRIVLGTFDHLEEDIAPSLVRFVALRLHVSRFAGTLSPPPNPVKKE
ncbi:MAG: hypothetical protein QM831_34465 [Kofleriaceae bacterium]